MLREKIAADLGLKEFELSQSCLAFWDKLERANYFLGAILDTADLPVSDRTVSFILSTGVHDGGQWAMFANIVRKYGLVPKEAFDETYQSSNTRQMNYYLNRYLKACAVRLRALKRSDAGEDEIRGQREGMMAKVYSYLCACYGEPPKRFDFVYTDKDGAYHCDPDLTPADFRDKYVGAFTDDMVSVINAPTSDKPYYRTYTIRYLGNVEGEGTPVEVPTSAISGWVTENNQYSDRMQSLRFNTGVILAYYSAFIHGSKGASDWRKVNDSEYTYLYGSQYATIIGYALDGATDTMPKLSPAVMLHDYDFTNVGGRSNPSVFNSSDVHPHELTIQRTAPFFVYDAYLDIEMKLNINLAPPDKQSMWDMDGTVELYVVIGDKQYNHLTETWESYTPSSAKNWFAVEYSNGELVKRNTRDWHYEEPQGFAIRADESLGGVMEVGIRSWHVNGSATDIQKSDCIITIERFSVKTLHHIRSLSEKSTFTATDAGQGNDDIDLDFCSERSSGNGVNSLFFANGSIVRTIMVASEVYARPEQWVADRHAAMTTGKARSLLMIRQVGDINDGIYTYNGKTYQTLLKKHEWAENITEVHLIETS